MWMENSSPAARAWGAIMAESCSISWGREIRIWFKVIFDRSILLISNTSLIRLSRCLEEMEIFCRQSATRSRSPICATAKAVIPIMAFMGVRISWLMAERKSLFA